jgi:transcriptional regulator with XRE-family HTH domain
MDSLKSIREKLQISQGQLSEKTGINIPTLSNYENGNTVPMLEDMIIIEQILGTRCNWQWKETITNNEKVKIRESLEYLMDYYPIQSVINFASRWLKNDTKLTGMSGIRHFARLSKEMDEEQEPLMPPTYKSKPKQ